MLKAIDVLAGLEDLHMLTAGGELGVVNAAGRLVVEHELTHALGPQIRQLLRSYLADPNRRGYRLGVIHRAYPHGPWGSGTFVMEPQVLREISPGGDEFPHELSEGQSRNDGSGIDRALELLIGHRRGQLTESPAYCPLLYHRGTSPERGLPASRGGESMPVLEVLNLFAVMPHGWRNVPAVAALMRGMQRSLAARRARRESESAARREYAAGHGADSPSAVRSHARVGSAPSSRPALDIFDRRLAAALEVQERDRCSAVEPWREQPSRFVDPQLLRRFRQFRDLQARPLAAVAENAPVYKAPGGVRLLEDGSADAWNMYLLEGVLALQAADGGSVLVAGGDDKAASPVSSLKPRKYTVTSRTSVSFLWIHDALLQALVSVSVEVVGSEQGWLR